MSKSLLKSNRLSHQENKTNIDRKKRCYEEYLSNFGGEKRFRPIMLRRAELRGRATKRKRKLSAPGAETSNDHVNLQRRIN